MAQAILTAIGGVDNIEEIDPCTTRLRALVRDSRLVDPAALRAAGTHGTLRTGRVVQIVVGPQVDAIAEELDELLDLS